MKKVVYDDKPLLAHLIDEERKRNAVLAVRYKKALKGLPKGKLYIRKVQNRYYAYLSRRIPGRKYPESKYIGSADSERVKELRKQLQDHARLKQQLAILAIERRMLEKALLEYRRSR